SYVFYDLPASAEHPEGAYEFEIILDARPESNIVSTAIETANLDFFYQPPLNQGVIDEGIDHCTETTCFDKDGNIAKERPENTVGSYAVYYKDNKSGDFSLMGGKNYRAGKAFHIYRPKIIDALGKWVWGDLQVSAEKGEMTIAVPQDFLDTAVYPIIVDPTFGYTTAGAGLDTCRALNKWVGTVYKSPFDNAVAVSISVYGYNWTALGTSVYKGMIVRASDLTIVTNAIGSAATPAEGVANKSWTTSTFAVSPKIIRSNDYYLSFVIGNAGTDTMCFYGDTGTNQSVVDTGNNYASPENPNPADFIITSIKRSIYATYTVAPTTKINTPLSGRFKDSLLVGYWSFDGADMGTTSATDLSGNNYTGWLQNGPKKAPGINGQGLSFDGTDDTITAGDISTIDIPINGALTGCAWVKHNTITTDDVIMAKNNTLSDGLQFFRDDTGAASGRTDTYAIYIFDSGDADSASLEGATSASTLNSWTHVCFTFITANATGLHLYINGTEDANSPISTSAIGSIDAGANVFRIGTLSDGTSDPFDGTIDEVRVYNRVLSASEIVEQYRAGAARMKVNTPITNYLTSGLIGNWTFNGPDINWGANIAYDRSGQGSNGLMTDMSTSSSPVAGINGQALKFDGVDDIVTINDKDLYTFASGGNDLPFSLSAWIKMTDATTFRAIVKLGATGAEWGLYTSAADRLSTSCYTNLTNYIGRYYNSTVTSYEGQWIHVASTYDGSKSASGIKVYLNGNQVDNTDYNLG
ncbi:MAG: LamG domain-containing protein, partial [Candidatus Komeilibacteria bacterium]